MRSRQYDDKDGNRRYITEIIAQRIQFLGGGGGTRQSQEASDLPPEEGPAAVAADEEDIPF